MRRASLLPRQLPLVILLALAPITSPAATAGIESPPQAAVDAAIAAPLIRYHRLIAGGAYTNGAWSGGASINLAVASHVGNTSADARLLQQIRYTLTTGNEICANGGYPAQHELHVTGMFAIARNTPRIWNQLTATEKSKTDLLMKASMVACAFTTSDNNPFVLAGTSQHTLNADPNIHRDWNPNIREGMIGGVLVGMVYFGGPADANAILDNYNHSQFVAELAAAGFSNAHETFNWKSANPSSAAPSGTAIQNAVKNYQYYGNDLTNYFRIYDRLVKDTYEKTVNSGLNGGAGINGAGKIASGAANLPNPGAVGMLKEFDSIDAGGPRSSLIYAYDGYRPHQTNQLVLITGGFWQKGSDIARQAVDRIQIGNTDLWYKINAGYIGYAKGKSQGPLASTFAEYYGLSYVLPLWESVLLPYHLSETPVDSDGDGTDDDTEALLDLDPNDPSSRFAATLSNGVLQWPSAADLTFTIQRNTSLKESGWLDIATIPGVAGSTSFTDPAPPAGRAFYRVDFTP